MLAKGARLEQEIEARCKDLGISKKSMRTAANKLGVIKKKREFQGPSWWHMPDDPELPILRPRGPVWGGEFRGTYTGSIGAS